MTTFWRAPFKRGLSRFSNPVFVFFFLLLTVFPLVGHAAISFVGASYPAGVNATAITFTKPAGVQQYDVMLVQLTAQRGATTRTFTPPSGWLSLNRQDNGSNLVQEVFWKAAGASEPASYTFTLNAQDRVSGGLLAYRGVSNTSPTTAVAGRANAASLNVVAPTIDTLVNDTLLLGFFGTAHGNELFSPPPGMIERGDTNTGAGPNGTTAAAADEPRPTAGLTGTRTALASAAARNIGQLVALRPARTFRVEAAATGAIGTQVAGTSFNIRITALNPNGTIDTVFTGTAGISSTGSLSVGSGTTAAFTAGVLASHAVRISNTGTFNLTATETLASNLGVSNDFLVVPKLQILVPGETANPGSASGKTGTPSTQTPGTAFNVTVNAVDEFWNRVATATDAITLTSSDAAAVLPATAALVSGTSVLAVTLNTPPSQTVTANASSPARANTSSAIALAAAVGGFNAYETSTMPATATSGVIKTKVAGTSFSLAVTALNSARTAILTSFTGSVKVELLDSSGGGALDANGCNAGWPVIQTLATNPVFVAGDNGRKTVSFQENNAWRNVRVRISHPATGVATAIGCSNDNFAVRPHSLSFTVTDGDWESAGTTRTLNNASTPGGTVHKAGRPFTITAVGYNGAATPAITTRYAGAPTANIVSHIIPSACLNGAGCTLSGGTFLDGTANDGMVSSATASYAEVGAFNLQLVDTSFADVDAGDSSTGERYISSATVAVGRFVPDRFALASGSRTPACTTGGAVLSYMSQPFTLAATLVAQNFAGGATENYASSSGGYAPATVVWQAENADSGANLGARLANAGATWDKGRYVVNSTSATFNRAGAPDGPYDSLQLGVGLADSDGPVLGALDMDAATSGACAPCTAKMVGAPISARFGRLRLLNAYGSELLALALPLEAQYWTGSSFARNASDSCTSLVAANVNLLNYQGGLSPTNMGIGHVTAVGTLVAGRGSVSLSRPSPASTAIGSMDLILNLGSTGATVTCPTATPPTPLGLSTSAAQPYLSGNWCGAAGHDRDPTARATFGIYKSPLIYRRENY